MRHLLFQRITAYLVDIVLLFTVLAPLGYLVQRAFGVMPSTSQSVYGALLLNFSLPAWTYFTWADRSRGGATLGKRWLSVRTETRDGTGVGTARALGRTAVKMIPWELTHASCFLLAPALGEFGVLNWVGLGVAYALSFLYLFVAWRTGGEQSVHDLAASTRVRAVEVTETSV